MSFTLYTEQHRANSGRGSIVLEQYADKFCPSFWRVYFVSDGRPFFGEPIAHNLKNKPNKRQIANYCANY